MSLPGIRRIICNAPRNFRAKLLYTIRVVALITLLEDALRISGDNTLLQQVCVTRARLLLNNFWCSPIISCWLLMSDR